MEGNKANSFQNILSDNIDMSINPLMPDGNKNVTKT